MDQKTLEEKLNEAMEPTVTQETPQEVIVPEKVKVGDAEYTQDELSRYVGLGKQGAELEERWNTKFDRLMPEYTKATQELKTYKEKLAELEAERSKQPSTPDAEQSKEALRILKEEFGVVTKGDLEDYYKTRREEERTQAEQDAFAKELSSKVTTLQKDIDGADGRPAFKPVEVLEFMKEEGIKDPMKAYKVLHEDALDAWKAARIVKGEPKDPIISVTKPTAGAKQPNSVRPTHENLQQMLNEALPDR